MPDRPDWPDGPDDGIAIVGMACLYPGAPDLATYWANIVDGVDAITEVPASRWDPVFFDPDAKGADRFYCNRGGFVDHLATFDPLAFGIMPVAMESAEPDQLIALGAAAAALADSGDVHHRVDPARVAVILGRGGYLGDGVARLDQRVRTAQQLVETLRSLLPGLDEDRIQAVKAEFQDRLGPERPEGSIGLVPNLAASRIANRFDFQGPAYTVDAACASSLIAVDQAADQLRSGRADVVVAGGVHHCHDLTLWSVFSQLRALSPSGAIRPFSEAADGILVGEGTGIVVLKRVADAERDGDRVYAVIAGTGVASDGRDASLMSPRPEGQVMAVHSAWRASGLDPAGVGLIEAHGTATAVGDRTELETLRTVFGAPSSSAPKAGLGSVKSMIGHAMPAAGAAGLIKAALAVYHGVLPPTLHVEEPAAAVADTRFRLISRAEPWAGDDRRLAGVNAFGFGGINAHVVLAEPHGLRAAAALAAPALVGAPVARAAVSDSEGPGSDRPGVVSATGVRGLADTEAPPTNAAASATAGPGSAGAVAGPAGEAQEDVLLLAGVDAADLLAQLDGWVPGQPTLTVPVGGPARLAVVAPDERRLTLARKVLERGTAFRGRNDVWFDPDGLVTAGGKVAFVFPGVEPVFEPRVDDVADLFDIAWEGLDADLTGLHSQGRGIVAVGRLLADALARIGIRPDAVAGHSLGEWTGQIVSGMIPDESVEEFLGSLRPGSVEVSDVVFVALGAGADVAAEVVAGLSDAHVSHDNCPHQSVVCAPEPAVAEILARAKAAKVLAQVLPFRSGFHSPLFAPYVAALADQFGAIPVVAATVPMWSATSVAPYPDDPDQARNLAGRHLVEPVRFRELAESLVDDGVRVFVQVGTGNLTGFLDDTLRDHDVLTISANVAKQTGIGQLRRVAAALWSVGAEVDFAPLGHRLSSTGPGQVTSVAPAEASEASAGGSSRPTPTAGLPLVLGSTLIRDLTPLDVTVSGAGAGAGTVSDGGTGIDDLGWPAADPAGSPMAGTAVGSAELLAEMRAALGEAGAAARAVLDAVANPAPRRPASVSRARRHGATGSPAASSATAAATGGADGADGADGAATRGSGPVDTAAPTGGGGSPIAAATPGSDGVASRDVTWDLSVADQPWWHDHSFYEQPADWHCLEDEFPLVPMTGIIEMLAAEAQALVPGTVAVRVESIRAFRWLAVEPPASVSVKVVVDAAATAVAPPGTTVVKASVDGHARAVIHLATEWPAAPAPEARPVTGHVEVPVAPERIYVERHLFHGPEYQGLAELNFGADGATGVLVAGSAPGALLDNAGQVFGLWMASAVDRDRLVLPTSIDSMAFYGPLPEPGSRVGCVVNCTSLTDQTVRADLELTVDGEVWCRILGWEDRRFQSDDRLFMVLRKPQVTPLAEPQPEGWVMVREGWPDSASRDVVMRRFLGQAERADYAGRNPNVQRTWLLGRIAAKDAVRTLLWSNGAGPVFPVEISVANDADGRPTVTGPGADDVAVSIAHTAGIGVALAAVGADVGIDIELVEPRPASFEATALTPAERDLLAAGPPSERDRTITRWWAAKEAAAKADGTGMDGRPRDFEVSQDHGDRVRIGNRLIATRILTNPAAPDGTAQPQEHVVAWTLIEPRDD
ncbi:MAG: polyketide synthase dehydratase domain-containing protein [Microthrixaceae bacterium]|nr:polyketide synthase dehydratase domain-containing protein [Acidimicrobiales bacterium]MCB9402872.1 polyketide synthase dehydratase domain-containing protein [Microthrixaceae bacterium]